MRLSVIVPAHNPHAGRLARTLAGLRAQTLAVGDWETLLVDNASQPPLSAPAFVTGAPANLRLLREPSLGLTAARRCGLRAATGGIVVLVDDDNVLAPDYLERVLAAFAAHPRVGALGGRVLPEFEEPPPEWVREFDGLLACRDLGSTPRVTTRFSAGPVRPRLYPDAAPVGAGMALRRKAVATWLDAAPGDAPSDRRGAELTSGGDNDIVLTVAREWDVAYFPDLVLTHLIPAGRTTRDYLGRLNRGIARSWVQVLALHQANPWKAIAPWTVPLRQAKAWLAYRPWRGPAAYVRWQGACGRFEGLASLPR